MVSAAKRIAKYTARMQSSLLDPVLAAVNALAVENFTTYAMDFYQKQLQLRAVLSGLSIATVKFGIYEAFHGEIYHLDKTTTGPAAITTATVLVAKYVGYGAVSANLIKILDDVYGIVVPPATP